MSIMLGVTKLEKGFKQFLVKTGLFLVAFIVIQMLLLVISKNIALPKEYYFIADMDIAKSLLFTVVIFFFLAREKFKDLKEFKFKIGTTFFFGIVSLLAFAGYFLLKSFLVNNPLFAVENILLFYPLKELILMLGTISLIIAVFGLKFLKIFVKKFKRELWRSFSFFLLALFLIIQFQKLWVYLSYIVAKAVYFLLNLTFNATLNFTGNSPNLGINNFIVNIGQPCSGIDSMLMFIFLYVFIAGYDWKMFNKNKLIAMFVPGIISVFVLNILRIYLLILIGAFVSKEIAIGIFHTNAGMIFFLVYFAIFWFVFYNWMKKSKYKKSTILNKFYKKIMGDSLYKNSIYLMLNTIVITGLGFFFWMINTRLFSVEDIGLATALISVMGLITSLSILGLNTGLIRYLPKAENKNKKINTAFTLVIISSIIITCIFLMFANTISPKLMFVHDNIILSFIFIFFMIVATINLLMESIFTSYRSTKYIVVKNIIFSISKLILPFFLVFLGAYGIFSSWMISMIMALIFSFIILMARFSYKPKFALHDGIIKKIGGYSFSNYVAGFIGGLPLLILPLLILSKLGAEKTAYYYMAMMIAALLFAIPDATSKSLFAEGSYNEKDLRKQIKKAIKIISLLLIPAIVIITFFGKYLLLLFGSQYSIEGFRFLQIIAVSSIFVTINTVFLSIFKIKNNIKMILTRNILMAVLIIGLSYLFISAGFGILGVSYGYLIGQFIASAVFFIWIIKKD